MTRQKLYDYITNATLIAAGVYAVLSEWRWQRRRRNRGREGE